MDDRLRYSQLIMPQPPWLHQKGSVGNLEPSYACSQYFCSAYTNVVKRSVYCRGRYASRQQAWGSLGKRQPLQPSKPRRTESMGYHVVDFQWTFETSNSPPHCCGHTDLPCKVPLVGQRAAVVVHRTSHVPRRSPGCSHFRCLLRWEGRGTFIFMEYDIFEYSSCRR